jgi:hypothetical protein
MHQMKNTSLLFSRTGVLIFLFIALSCCGQGVKETKITDYTSQWDSLTVLKNPHKGWYHHYYDNGTGSYGIGGDGLGFVKSRHRDEFDIFTSFPGMDHLYLRLAWSYLEPKEGQYDWYLIDSVVAKYVPLGYGLSFRISCRETGPYPGSVGEQVDGIHYATPKWVRDAGAQGTLLEGEAAANVGSVPSWAPDYGDPVFLAKLENFHRAFAARYDGQPYVRYIDIGSVGDWGEGHTHFSTRKETTNEVLKKHIDMFLRLYKKSQLVVVEGFLVYEKEPDGEARLAPTPLVKEIFEYMKSKGMALRCDSFLVDWYMQVSTDTWSVTRPYLFEQIYRTKPVIYELEHYSYAKREGHFTGKNGSDINRYGASGATFMEKSMELAHATYIGFHGYINSWWNDNPDFTKHIANRVGYWYFPVRAQYAPALTGTGNRLEITWQNKGVAPAYNRYALLLHFAGRDASFDIEIADSDNLQWMPDGKDYTGRYTYDLPATATPGDYQLSFRLYDHATKTTVQVAVNKDHLINGEWIPVGKVTIVR